MTARIVLLMVAVVGLAACESTKAVDTQPSTPVAVQTPPPVEPSSPTVVRSALVPDDEESIAAYRPKKHRVKAPSYDTAAADPVEASEPAAPVSKPEKPAKPSKPSKPDTASVTPPVTTADAGTPPPAAPTDTTTTPAPTDTAPDDSATPTTTDVAPVADGTAPKSLFSDPAALLQAQFGGFPVWLIGLVGLVLIIALMVGLGGRKKPEEVI